MSNTHMPGLESMGRNLYGSGTELRPVYQSEHKLDFIHEPVYESEPKIGSKPGFL